MGLLKEYADLFERLGLTELSVEEKDIKLTLKKEIKQTAGDYSFCMDGAKSASGGNAKTDARSDAEHQEDSAAVSGTEVKAPILGVFYANETPIKEGDTVEKGDVLCTIEAMKMMNEVRSPASGKVMKTFAENGALVEYHQTLYVIA